MENNHEVLFQGRDLGKDAMKEFAHSRLQNCVDVIAFLTNFKFKI